MEKNIDILINHALDRFEEQMRKTPQSPKFHGEGDVYTHTIMVCDALKSLPEYNELDEEQKQILLVAAMLHDVGKIYTTVFEEDGDWHSPHHAPKGSRVARELMFKEFGIGGEKSLIEFREAVCLLIRYHSFPPHALDQYKGVLKLHKIASNSLLTPKFSLKLLYILSKADVLGRKSDDTKEMLDEVELFKEFAIEEECYEASYKFKSEHSRRAFLLGKDMWKDDDLYDDTWGEVVIMSGLPGSGKDRFINDYLSHLPMVSLDEIRKEKNISPNDNQGVVANIAREQAKEYLRSHTPFVWNATNLTEQMRESVVGMCETYKARVRINYIEASSWEQLLSQNRDRKEIVPQNVIENMLKKLVPPYVNEAEIVEWWVRNKN